MTLVGGFLPVPMHIAGDADVSEATDAIATLAAAGATIVVLAVRSADGSYDTRLREQARAHPDMSEDQLGWLAVEELSVAAAKQLEPAFVAYAGRNGRVSVQTDPRLNGNPEGLVAHAIHLATLAPNVILKIPATSAGIIAVEEATYRGISINATVSFSDPQALAAGAAVERGLERRDADGDGDGDLRDGPGMHDRGWSAGRVVEGRGPPFD
jgi:transaldolase